MGHSGRVQKEKSSLGSMLNKFWTLGTKSKSGGAAVEKMPSQSKALSDGLIMAGVCDRTGVERAWRGAQATGKTFTEALTRLSVASEYSIAQTSANILNLPLARLQDFPTSPILLENLRPCFLRQARCCPIRLQDGYLVIGLVDGFDDFTPKAIAAKTGLAIECMIVVPIDLDLALARLYPEDTVKASTESSFVLGESDTEMLECDMETALVVKHVESTIISAVDNSASDIHFESYDDRLIVRFRYDGKLVDIDLLPPNLSTYIISRLKIMARLDIAEKRLPQDGRFRLSVRGREVNFRLSTMPSLYGEKAVVRILDKARLPLDFDTLGFEDSFIKRWLKCLTSENGILLVVGPTGSGKSTTLYTSLQELARGETNIVTVEDPVEYRLTRVNQSQVKPQIGLTFASCLRSILRQDPDVIMVGEIRDLETAEIAVQAAMTGHLVLSTLHANSASAAIVRLRDLGLEDYKISSVIRGIAAQRLVRKLCSCKRQSKSLVDVHRFFGRVADAEADNVTQWEPVGCPDCRGTGYKGRFAIAELLVPSINLRTLIAQGASQVEMEAELHDCGMQSLFDIAQTAVIKGMTAVCEIAKLNEAA